MSVKARPLIAGEWSQRDHFHRMKGGTRRAATSRAGSSGTRQTSEFAAVLLMVA
jgi:hypothetical protein